MPYQNQMMPPVQYPAPAALGPYSAMFGMGSQRLSKKQRPMPPTPFGAVLPTPMGMPPQPMPSAAGLLGAQTAMPPLGLPPQPIGAPPPQAGLGGRRYAEMLRGRRPQGY